MSCSVASSPWSVVRGPVVHKIRLGILASHPIQYHAPWFRELVRQLDLHVFYAHRQDAGGQAAAGFDVEFDWDVPLTGGYPHRWLKNVAVKPGLNTFGGCDTPEIYNVLRNERFDAFLIMGWNRKSFIQGIRACRRAGVPVLMRGDSQLNTPRSRLKSLVKYLPYRWLLPRLDAHLYVGKRNKAYLQHYGVRDEQLFFCPHFVDNDFFALRSSEARSSGAARAIRDEFRIPRDARLALFVGKFIAKKRPEDFLSASLRAAKARKDFHALLIGDGPLRGELESIAAANIRQIHFAGFRNQSKLPEFYAAADVLSLPSDGAETWGLVVNEAMACGLPVIVSDAVGCAPDLIDVGVTGWTFPQGDIERLAARLTDFEGINPNAVRQKAAAYSMTRASEGLRCALNAIAPHQT